MILVIPLITKIIFFKITILPSKQARGGPPGGPRRHLWRPTGGKRRGAAGESETGFAEGPLEAAPPGTTGDHRGTAGDFWREGDFSSGPLDDFLWGSASVKTSEAPPGISDEGPLAIFRVGLGGGSRSGPLDDLLRGSTVVKKPGGLMLK